MTAQKPCSLRWENRPINVTVPVIELNPEHERIVDELVKQAESARDTANAMLRDEALDDLRQQLADTRAERDRYIARCKELEARLQSVREAVK